ncbi:unnamed protein product, partial [marine sediment metagenome]
MKKKNFWFSEKHIPGFGIILKIKRILSTRVSNFQKVEIFETESFGKMMVIDGMVMFTEADEFVYHEMLTHVPLFVHSKIKNVLIV